MPLTPSPVKTIKLVKGLQRKIFFYIFTIKECGGPPEGVCGRISFYISGVKFGLVETPEREVFLSCYVTLWEGKVQVAIRVCQKYFSVHNLGVP